MNLDKSQFLRRHPSNVRGVFNRSISWKLFPILAVGALVCGIGVWVGVPIIMERGIKADTLANAEKTVKQFKIIRGYYTNKVISKVVKSKVLKPTYTHDGSDGEIPLPATFIHDLSELLSETGVILKLYSPYPFPIRAERDLDTFGQSAWEALSNNPDKSFVRTEIIDGRDVVRVAVSDTMVSQVCVNCHNNHADTPKDDWNLNDLRGVLEIDTDVTKALDRGTWIGRGIALALLGFFGAVIVLTFFRLRAVVIGPVGTMTKVMGTLATGNLEVDIPKQGQVDEIGDMARTVQVFKNNAIELKKTQNELAKTNSELSTLNTTLENRAIEIEHQTEELERALKREQEFNTLQREFVAMVSHEFRTPITIIDGSAQRIARRAEKVTPEELLTRTGKIRDAVTRMTGLIESTLSTARLDAGTIAMESKAVDLAALVTKVCRDQNEISRNHSILVNVENLGETMWGDHKLLEQVFTNLVSNAVKYSPNAPHIEVMGRQENDETIVTVRDRGLGIPADELPKLFKRYFRASTSLGIAGTGIGLNLVKELVEMHGGRVDVQSGEGDGSTFTIRLPTSDVGQPVGTKGPPT